MHELVKFVKCILERQGDLLKTEKIGTWPKRQESLGTAAVKQSNTQANVCCLCREFTPYALSRDSQEDKHNTFD